MSVYKSKYESELTSQMVKETALSLGADLCGIGSMDRYEGAPKDSDPRFLFPEAKSVIGLAFRVHRGLYRPMEEGTHWGMYSSVGYANVNDVHMPVVMRELGAFIEDYGYEAVIYNNTAVRYNTNKGIPVREGYPKPAVFLHLRISAVICGMGEIGWSNIFLTPEFGPRQRLAFIFSDVELEPDPIMEPRLCDNCKICVKSCSSKAISENESVEFTLKGKTYKYAKLNEERCNVGWQCGNEEINPFLYDGSDNAEIARWMIHNVYKDDDPSLNRRKIHSRWAGQEVMYSKHEPSATGVYNFRHPGCMCGTTCQKECMIHLESQGKLENKFHTKFRIRKPWRLDPTALLARQDEEKRQIDVIKSSDTKLTNYDGR